MDGFCKQTAAACLMTMWISFLPGTGDVRGSEVQAAPPCWTVQSKLKIPYILYQWHNISVRLGVQADSTVHILKITPTINNCRYVIKTNPDES